MQTSVTRRRANLSYMWTGRGRRIRKRREELRLTPEALAQKVGVSRISILKWESQDDMEIKGSNIQALEDALEKPRGWVLEGEDLLGITAVRRGLKRALAPAPVKGRSGEITIPQLDVLASMGPGAIPADHIDVVRNVIANVDQLRRQCSFTAPHNLQIITGYGESMMPTYNDGDPLLVDTGVRDVKVDAVYVFYYDGELFIKRVQRMPGKTLRVISDNRQSHDPWDIPPDKMPLLNVCGRVVLAWNARKL